MNQPLFVAWAKHARAAWVNHTRQFLTTTFLILATTLAAMAQTYDEVPLSQFTHALSAGNATLGVGDTAWFALTLGSSADPAQDVVGVRLELAIDGTADLPVAMPVQVTGSWCLDAANLHTALDVEDTPPAISLTARADDWSSTSGHGFALRFPLVCNTANTPANSLIDNVGGVVIVENVDAKRAAPNPKLQPTTDIPSLPFPNPTMDVVRLPFPLEAEMRVELIAPDGNALRLQAQAGTDLLDLRALAPGTYLLRVSRGPEVLLQARIAKL